MLDALAVTMENFRFAIGQTNHSALREMVVGPGMTLEALNRSSRELQELVQYLVEFPEKALLEGRQRHEEELIEEWQRREEEIRG